MFEWAVEQDKEIGWIGPPTDATITTRELGGRPKVELFDVQAVLTWLAWTTVVMLVIGKYW